LTSRKHVGTRLVIIDVCLSMDVHQYVSLSSHYYLIGQGRVGDSHTHTSVTTLDFCLQYLTSVTRLPAARQSSGFRLESF
jgi:hypothetical protein